MLEARHPLRAADACFDAQVQRTALPTQSSPSEDGDLRCDLPRPHVTREPACNGSHCVGGSITDAREDPAQAGDRVVLFVEALLGGRATKRRSMTSEQAPFV